MTKKERAFIKTVWDYYAQHKRHTLPWRKTKDPYRIHVSEVMLQQTQVDRVIPKYTAFIKVYPTVKKLADAQRKDVFALWQGLGYNRRAKLLHECARCVVTDFNGTYPSSYHELKLLPGIGPYTAAAIMVFAHNVPVALIETNVRSVYLHHFFADESEVPDTELLPYIERTQDSDNPRDWFYALMDYGTYIKKTFGNPNRKSKQNTVQSTFKGSDRQIRGAIVKLLVEKPYTRAQFHAALSMFEDLRIDAQLHKLAQEGMITKGKTLFTLP